MPLSSRTALREPSQPATQAAVIVRDGAVGLSELRLDVIGLLLECGELGVPSDRHAELSEFRPHDALVVVLAEHQDERIGAEVLADVADRDTRLPFPVGPQIGGGGDLAERERLLDQSHPGVDLQGAGLHADRARLLRRPGMAVDDRAA